MSLQVYYKGLYIDDLSNKFCGAHSEHCTYTLQSSSRDVVVGVRPLVANNCAGRAHAKAIWHTLRERDRSRYFFFTSGTRLLQTTTITQSSGYICGCPVRPPQMFLWAFRDASDLVRPVRGVRDRRVHVCHRLITMMWHGVRIARTSTRASTSTFRTSPSTSTF